MKLCIAPWRATLSNATPRRTNCSTIWSITFITRATGRPTRRWASSCAKSSARRSARHRRGPGHTTVVDRPRRPGVLAGMRPATPADGTLEDDKTQATNLAAVTLGLIQSRCSPDPGGEFCPRRCERMAAAARQGRANHLHPGTVSLAVFLPERGPREFQAGRADPRPQHATPCKSWPASHKVVIIASLFERRGAGLYHNTAAVIDADGSLLGIYRKMHIPDDPLYYEKFYFTPGDLGFRAWPTRYGKIGVCVCWDQWYPEAARLTALQGAEILFYPTAIGWHPAEKAAAGRDPTWRLGNHPAQPRHRQRLLCRRRQPGGLGKAGRRTGPGILGPEFCRRHLRRNPGQGRGGRRGNADRPGGPQPRWKPPAPTGPSCATAALTPTAI